MTGGMIELVSLPYPLMDTPLLAVVELLRLVSELGASILLLFFFTFFLFGDLFRSGIMLVTNNKRNRISDHYLHVFTSI